MDAVPIVPPLFRGTKNTTLHELQTHDRSRATDTEDPPPLVFSSKDAKLFLATLDEMLTALWRTPPAGLPVQARGRWDQGRLIEPTHSVSAPFVPLSTTLSGENTAHGQWQRSFDC